MTEASRQDLAQFAAQMIRDAERKNKSLAEIETERREAGDHGGADHLCHARLQHELDEIDTDLLRFALDIEAAQERGQTELEVRLRLAYENAKRARAEKIAQLEAAEAQVRRTHSKADAERMIGHAETASQGHRRWAASKLGEIERQRAQRAQANARALATAIRSTAPVLDVRALLPRADRNSQRPTVRRRSAGTGRRSPPAKAAAGGSDPDPDDAALAAVLARIQHALGVLVVAREALEDGAMASAAETLFELEIQLACLLYEWEAE